MELGAAARGTCVSASAAARCAHAAAACRTNTHCEQCQEHINRPKWVALSLVAARHGGWLYVADASKLF